MTATVDHIAGQTYHGRKGDGQYLRRGLSSYLI